MEDNSIYFYADVDGEGMGVFPANIWLTGDLKVRGVSVEVDYGDCMIPDDEIPNLIKALQRHLDEKEG